MYSWWSNFSGKCTYIFKFCSSDRHLTHAFVNPVRHMPHEDGKKLGALNREHPFTSFPVPAYSPVVQRLHFMFGNTSRTDSAGTQNFSSALAASDRLSEALLGANNLPMLYAVLKGWAHIGKQYMITAKDEVDELMQKS
jgi:hypothetical protein